jgi:hypothetical protein
MHPLAQRLRTIHCDPLKAKSANEARQLSAPHRGKRHIATDGFYVVQVLSGLEKVSQFTQRSVKGTNEVLRPG